MKSHRQLVEDYYLNRLRFRQVENRKRGINSPMPRLLDLDNPRGMNELIQWLKVYDQSVLQIIACNKIAVREMVAPIIGRDCLIPASFEWPPKSFPCVGKCNNDSGSYTFMTGPQDMQAAHKKLYHRLRQPYGYEKGEWAYSFIKPALIIEEKLPDPVVDFKFHCSGGKIRFVQVIWDRPSGRPREVILTPDGAATPYETNAGKFIHDKAGAKYAMGEAWERLSLMAEALAAGWRYVRVDLLWSMDRPWFGELTFWPRSGFFDERDEQALGYMLQLDLSNPTTLNM